MSRISERELKRIERFLLGLGLALLGYVAWVSCEATYVEWRFARQLAGVQHPVHQQDDTRRLAARPTPSSPLASKAHAEPVVTTPNDDGFLGVLEVPRLELSTVIFEGIDGKTLRRSVGHIPGTALPGAIGNVGIAGHRDRFFGGLKDLVVDDLMLVRTARASYTYRVDSLRVVAPDQTDVLESSGGRELTLVTCYPFYFVGPAPERFVVFAHQIEEAPVMKPEALPVPVSATESSIPVHPSQWSPHMPLGTMRSTGHPAFCSLSLPVRFPPALPQQSRLR